MFNWPLFFRLLFTSLSFERDSLHFISLRRLLVILIIVPFFLVHILINRIFMFLDWIFFPFFLKVKIDRPLFIIGVPRSATTYLLEVMASDNRSFTSFRLWEIIFAPSIIQKYFWCGVIWLDRRTGRPLFRLSRIYDKVVLGRITKIHRTGMTNAEEDEMLLLYAFSSMYLNFIFPESPAIDEMIYFDSLNSPFRRKKIMNYYRRCVQRHLFVFGARGSKTFLSKNPCFISKIESVAETFPDARLIYMLRSPLKTIPSLISMNNNIQAILCSFRDPARMNVRSRDVAIRWYQDADMSLRKLENRYLLVRFDDITKQPGKTLKEIYQYAELVPDERMVMRMTEEQKAAENYTSTHKYNAKAGVDESVILEALAGLHIRVE